jgi:hypothetical protein
MFARVEVYNVLAIRGMVLNMSAYLPIVAAQYESLSRRNMRAFFVPR